MRDRVRWGILGCAGIAEKALIPAIAGSRSGLLQAIAARDADRASAWAGKYGFVRAHRDYGALVEDPEVDAVYNPLPNHLHAEWSIRAARAGKHVLCEKPMALDAAEVRDMIAAAGASGVLLMEAFMYKFHPQIERALGLLRSGAIGELRSVQSSFTFTFERGGDNYRWSPGMGGGALYDVGCYTISAARLAFGEEPLSAFARARLDPRTGIDMTAAVLLEFPGERFATCDCSFESHFQSRLLAVGTAGTLHLDRVFSAKDQDARITIVRGAEAETIVVPRTDMFALMVEHFGESVLEGKPLRYPAADAERNMRVLDAAFESIRTSRPVKVPAGGPA
jgi:D-xylose 1-dehydrogenase (NADP+, D-xylono-1,5-lactone-forming)